MRPGHWIIAAALAGAAAAALAAGSTSSSSQPERDDPYDRAVSAVRSQQFDRASRLLADVVRADPGNADAWNWLGYSHRKLGRFEESLDAYEKALSIDPEHRGALEYLGELYVQTGEIEKAKEQLRRLDDACGVFGCEEYDDLKSAIERAAAGG